MAHPTKRARIDVSDLIHKPMEEYIPAVEMSRVVKLGLQIFVDYSKGLHDYSVVYLLSCASPNYTLNNVIRKAGIVLHKNCHRLVHYGLIGKFYSVIFLPYYIPHNRGNAINYTQNKQYGILHSVVWEFVQTTGGKRYLPLQPVTFNKRIHKFVGHISSHIRYTSHNLKYTRILKNIINALSNSSSWEGAFMPHYSNDYVLSYLYYNLLFNCMLYSKNIEYITTIIELFPESIIYKRYERFSIDIGNDVVKKIIMLSRVSSEKIYHFVRAFANVAKTRYTNTPGLNEISARKILNELYLRWNDKFVFSNDSYDKWLERYAVPKIKIYIHRSMEFQKFVGKSENPLKAIRVYNALSISGVPLISLDSIPYRVRILLTFDNIIYIAKTCTDMDIIQIAKRCEDPVGFRLLWKYLTPEQRHNLHNNINVRMLLDNLENYINSTNSVPLTRNPSVGNPPVGNPPAGNLSVGNDIH
jgi:hypothetical protein